MREHGLSLWSHTCQVAGLPWLSWGARGRRGGHSPGQIEAVVDDLRPVDDRDVLEGATEHVTLGGPWGRPCSLGCHLGTGPWAGDGMGRQAPTSGLDIS